MAIIASDQLTIVNLIKNNNVLWTGDLSMTSEDTVELSENIKEQNNGICLVFSESNNQSLTTFFIPKNLIDEVSNVSHSFTMFDSSLYISIKKLYISNGNIFGDDSNNETGISPSGISYSNDKFTLKYVIGV